MSASTPAPVTPSSPRPILQPRTPTGVSPSPDSPVIRIPADNHGFKSDLDPTEWKPKSSRAGRPKSNRYDSEAFRYLSSFHRVIDKNDNDIPPEIRIDLPDMNTISVTAPATPSSGSTPTTTASSWSVSTSAGHAGYGGYDYNIRPLMPRHNRWYSTSVIGAAGTDLVTPHIPPPLTDYEKKNLVMGKTSKGGIGTFLVAIATRFLK